MKKQNEKIWGVDLKTYLLLTTLGILGSLAALPYVQNILGEVAKDINIWFFFAQMSISMIILVFFGLKISKKIGLNTTPLIDKKTKLKEILKPSIKGGILAAILIILITNIEIILKGGFMATLEEQVITLPPFWQPLLASFYGGITEELIMRLFALSFYAFIIIAIIKIFKKRKWEAGSKVIWTAIILSSILFGIGHLGAVASTTTLTVYLILQTIILNAIGGIIFGWLFWKKGLESAMIAHFSADIILHVIWPLALTLLV